MNYLQYHNAKSRLEETYKQAYRDHLARSQKLGIRNRFAQLLSILAAKLQSHPTAPTELAIPSVKG